MSDYFGRNFPPVSAPEASISKGVSPLGVAVIGPPGSGKTRSILRMMEGAKRVYPGRPAVLIDSEGRSKKYSPKEGQKADPSRGTYDFTRIDLDPPYRSDRCLEAIRMALKLNPCALGFDCLSDEHDGEGGYLEWHDYIAGLKKGDPDYVGGNEWAAWAKPAAARKRLSSALLHITTPLFFSFRAVEKTAQEKDGNRTKIVNLGWMPVAPLLIVKALDLTCILPYDSKGVPVWEAQNLPGEDFIRKWPDYLMNVFKKGQLNEETGEALVRWASGMDATTPAPDRAAILAEIKTVLKRSFPGKGKPVFLETFGVPFEKEASLPPNRLLAGLQALKAKVPSVTTPQPEIVAPGGPGAQFSGTTSTASTIRQAAEAHGLSEERLRVICKGDPEEVPDSPEILEEILDKIRKETA